MIVLGGYEAFIETLAFYLVVIAILGGGLILWGLINFWRFKNKDLRAKSEMTSLDDIARDFGFEADQLDRYQRSKRLIVKFNQDEGVREISET